MAQHLFLLSASLLESLEGPGSRNQEEADDGRSDVGSRLLLGGVAEVPVVAEAGGLARVREHQSRAGVPRHGAAVALVLALSRFGQVGAAVRAGVVAADHLVLELWAVLEGRNG